MLLRFPGVIGVYLRGSYVTAQFRPLLSDIDFVILICNGQKPRYYQMLFAYLSTLRVLNPFIGIGQTVVRQSELCFYARCGDLTDYPRWRAIGYSPALPPAAEFISQQTRCLEIWRNFQINLSIATESLPGLKGHPLLDFKPMTEKSSRLLESLQGALDLPASSPCALSQPESQIAYLLAQGELCAQRILDLFAELTQTRMESLLPESPSVSLTLPGPLYLGVELAWISEGALYLVLHQDHLAEPHCTQRLIEARSIASSRKLALRVLGPAGYALTWPELRRQIILDKGRLPFHRTPALAQAQEAGRTLQLMARLKNGYLMNANRMRSLLYEAIQLQRIINNEEHPSHDPVLPLSLSTEELFDLAQQVSDTNQLAIVRRQPYL